MQSSSTYFVSLFVCINLSKAVELYKMYKTNVLKSLLGCTVVK